MMDFSDPLTKAYLFYGTVVLLKMALMSTLTSLTRIRKKVFATEEDVNMVGGKVKFDDQDVERIRRCHLNDMENVYLFVLLAALYCVTRPTYWVAVWHFRAFALSRIAHSAVYLGKTPQPARGVCFGVGLVVCLSMAVQTLGASFR